MADKEVVRKVAKLARLDLTEKELGSFSRDMEDITKAFSVIRKVKTDRVEPTFQPVERKNILRDDVIEDSISRDILLKGLKNQEKGFIKGPKAV